MPSFVWAVRMLKDDDGQIATFWQTEFYKSATAACKSIAICQDAGLTRMTVHKFTGQS
jgi:hypothetical protein